MLPIRQKSNPYVEARRSVRVTFLLDKILMNGLYQSNGNKISLYYKTMKKIIFVLIKLCFNSFMNSQNHFPDRGRFSKIQRCPCRPIEHNQIHTAQQNRKEFVVVVG